MDGTKIEELLMSASAYSAQGHQRATRQIDFCTPGMKSDQETNEFLFEVKRASRELIEAASILEVVLQLYKNAKQ